MVCLFQDAVKSKRVAEKYFLTYSNCLTTSLTCIRFGIGIESKSLAALNPALPKHTNRCQHTPNNLWRNTGFYDVENPGK
jgi:hypothetical protein